MTATAIPTVPYLRPICDTRPRRGKHRTRRALLDRLAAVAAHQRPAAYLAATTLGGILAAVLS